MIYSPISETDTCIVTYFQTADCIEYPHHSTNSMSRQLVHLNMQLLSHTLAIWGQIGKKPRKTRETLSKRPTQGNEAAAAEIANQVQLPRVNFNTLPLGPRMLLSGGIILGTYCVILSQA